MIIIIEIFNYFTILMLKDQLFLLIINLHNYLYFINHSFYLKKILKLLMN